MKYFAMLLFSITLVFHPKTALSQQTDSSEQSELVAPKNLSEAKELGIIEERTGRSFFVEPGAKLFDAPNMSEFVRSDGDICYQGPCVRDRNGNLTGRQIIGYWFWDDIQCDPDLAENIVGRCGWYCETYHVRAPHCVP